MARAVRIYSYGGPPQIDGVSDPAPDEGELLVEVAACGVNPADWKRARGDFATLYHHDMPMTLGGELAGRVAALGEGVQGFDVGDVVFGTTGCYQYTGAFSTRVALPAAMMCRKPARLSLLEAGGASIAALTAWQALHDHGQLRPGQRVLVHGAAGGVGSCAVQLARLARAEVIGTASAANLEYVYSLGAARVIDYRAERFEQTVSEVDLVLDLIGGEVERRSWAVLKPRGILLALNPRLDTGEGYAQRGQFFAVVPNETQLCEIAALFEAGSLRMEIARAFPMAEVEEAFRQSQTRHVRGKLVLDATTLS